MVIMSPLDNSIDSSNKPDAADPSAPAHKPTFTASGRIVSLPRTNVDLSGFVGTDRWMVGKYER